MAGRRGRRPSRRWLTNELEELVWLPLPQAMELDIPLITRTVLGDLQARLADDPDLRPGGPVPFYRMRGNRFLRTCCSPL